MTMQKTKDYSKFRACAFNRNINTKPLEMSMRTHGYIDAYPLHVVKRDGKLEIKDGHHRFFVARLLGLEIPYVICDDKASMHDLVLATNQWSISDYLTSFVRTGDPDYVAVQEYSERTGISVRMSMSMMGGEMAANGNLSTQFKTGEYKISNDLTHANQVAALVATIKDGGYSWSNAAPCVASLSRIISGGEACFEQLKQKIKANINLIEQKRSQDDYMVQWEDCYNKKVRGQKIPLVFLTNEAIKKRAVINFETNLKRKA